MFSGRGLFYIDHAGIVGICPTLRLMGSQVTGGDVGRSKREPCVLQSQTCRNTARLLRPESRHFHRFWKGFSGVSVCHLGFLDLFVDFWEGPISGVYFFELLDENG